MPTESPTPDLTDPQHAMAHVDAWLAQCPQPTGASLGASDRMLTALRTVARAIQRLPALEAALAAADEHTSDLEAEFAARPAIDPDDEITTDDL